MPDVTGKRLDVAKSDIKDAGFTKKVDVQGGGVFGVIEDSNWQVCGQTPNAGQPLTKPPRLTVDRDCGGDSPTPTEGPTPSSTLTASQQPSPTPIKATNITVDALLDRLNAVNTGGIHTGDRFRLSGELFESDAWGVGATGEFSVQFKAKGGRDDLMVFVNESDADGWQNGTKVEMVVQVEERTVNDETSGGWLKALSVRTSSG